MLTAPPRLAFFNGLLEPQKAPPIDFAPGQFVWLNLDHSPFSLTEHPFSISSSPAERPRIEFTIKQSGDFTDQIGTVPLGATAYVDGPYGNFTYFGRAATRLVFIAGGVGFAPIISMLRQLRADSWPHRIRLIYGNRVASQILYQEELMAMREILDLDIRLVLSEPPADWSGLIGELSRDVLRACLEPVDKEACYFLCGPTRMLNSVERSLTDLGVQSAHIISERFKYD